VTVRAGWWLPPDLRDVVQGEVLQDRGGIQVAMPQLDSAGLAHVAATLRGRPPRHRTSWELCQLLGTLSEQWLDPGFGPRQHALASLPAITGFSPEMVAESLNLEMRASGTAHLWRTLEAELGDPRVLDGFVHSSQRGARTHALGPELVGAVFSSNIPALPHLTVMRALLVKGAFLGRSATGEPTFLPAYLESLHALAPDVAAACAVLWWPREDKALEQAHLGGIDLLVGWGGQEAEAHYRAAMPAERPVVFHGHRLGIAVIGPGADLDQVATGLARDTTVFDQHACLSPHVALVVGHDLKALGDRISVALEAERARLPEGRPDPGVLAAVTQRRGVAELEAAMGSEQLWTPPDGSAAWTVATHSGPGLPVSPLGRFLTLVPARDLADLLARLDSWSGLFQNAAVAWPENTGETVALALAQRGASRLCPPGMMASPSMMWHHDGHACLAAMVRWCDEESSLPEELKRMHQDVLRFWFGTADAAALCEFRPVWFRRDDAFDAQAQARFSGLYAQACAGDLDHWAYEPGPSLALVLLLDQLSRNLNRGSHLSWAQDAHALRITEQALAAGHDQRLGPMQRTFLYMPLMHSEDVGDQDRCVALFEGIEAAHPGVVAGGLKAARDHREIVRRFGRFPHRNAVLGRESTDEELDFLEQPGSSF